MVSSFLMVDGVLSVFVFPALVMGWTKRIGGCVGKDERVGSGSFWISVVVLRIFLSASGKTRSFAHIDIYFLYLSYRSHIKSFRLECVYLNILFRNIITDKIYPPNISFILISIN